MEINLLIYLAILLPSILVSITLHEAMHAYVGHWLGDDTAFHEGRLTLNPIVHIDPLTTIALPIFLAIIGLPPFGAAKPVPFNPFKIKWGEWGEALVGVAGPLTNLALAIIAGLILRLADLTGMLENVFLVFATVNLAFFIFNLIPFPPLDGSRVLYAIAPDGIRSVMRMIEATGFMGILIFMFLIFPLIRPVFLDVFQSAVNLIVGN